MAHGQATRRTARLLSTARPASPTTSHQVKKVTMAPMSTAGTNTLLIRSAIRCNGALSLCASSTRRCRWANTDSSATDATVTTNVPFPFRVPPVTKLPGPRSTGSGSPVSIDSSTGDHPERTVPSRGIASSGRTRMRAPTGRLSGGTKTPSWSSTPTTTRAVGGRSESRECIAFSAHAPRPHFDRPPGRQDGHDQRGHHSVQPGREGASATQVHVPTAKSDGLDSAHPQRRPTFPGR